VGKHFRESYFQYADIFPSAAFYSIKYFVLKFYFAPRYFFHIHSDCHCM